MRECKCCGVVFRPLAEGQVVCTFHCARQLVPLGETKATRAVERADKVDE